MREIPMDRRLAAPPSASTANRRATRLSRQSTRVPRLPPAKFNSMMNETPTAQRLRRRQRKSLRPCEKGQAPRHHSPTTSLPPPRRNHVCSSTATASWYNTIQATGAPNKPAQCNPPRSLSTGRIQGRIRRNHGGFRRSTFFIPQMERG